MGLTDSQGQMLQIEFLVYRAINQPYVTPTRTTLLLLLLLLLIIIHNFFALATTRPFSLILLNLYRKCSLKLFHLLTVVKINWELSKQLMT